MVYITPGRYELKAAAFSPHTETFYAQVKLLDVAYHIDGTNYLCVFGATGQLQEFIRLEVFATYQRGIVAMPYVGEPPTYTAFVQIRPWWYITIMRGRTASGRGRTETQRCVDVPVQAFGLHGSRTHLHLVICEAGLQDADIRKLLDAHKLLMTGLRRGPRKSTDAIREFNHAAVMMRSALVPTRDERARRLPEHLILVVLQMARYRMAVKRADERTEFGPNWGTDMLAAVNIAQALERLLRAAGFDDELNAIGPIRPL